MHFESNFVSFKAFFLRNLFLKMAALDIMLSKHCLLTRLLLIISLWLCEARNNKTTRNSNFFSEADSEFSEEKNLRGVVLLFLASYNKGRAFTKTGVGTQKPRFFVRQNPWRYGKEKSQNDTDALNYFAWLINISTLWNTISMKSYLLHFDLTLNRQIFCTAVQTYHVCGMFVQP